MKSHGGFSVLPELLGRLVLVSSLVLFYLRCSRRRRRHRKRSSSIKACRSRTAATTPHAARRKFPVRPAIRNARGRGCSHSLGVGTRNVVLPRHSPENVDASSGFLMFCFGAVGDGSTVVFRFEIVVAVTIVIRLSALAFTAFLAPFLVDVAHHQGTGYLPCFLTKRGYRLRGRGGGTTLAQLAGMKSFSERRGGGCIREAWKTSNTVGRNRAITRFVQHARFPKSGKPIPTDSRHNPPINSYHHLCSTSDLVFQRRLHRADPLFLPLPQLT